MKRSLNVPKTLGADLITNSVPWVAILYTLAGQGWERFYLIMFQQKRAAGDHSILQRLAQ